MPTSFEIKSSATTYRVSIKVGVIQEILCDKNDHFIIADEYFSSFLSTSGSDYITIPAIETAKALGEMPGIIEKLRQRKISRNTTLVAFGGGVIQDIVGFLASIYMRGIPWIYVPTTLLAMADSCIGGKSSINVGSYKNIVGTFYPPRSVEIDPGLTRTLSLEQRVAGLCEAAKICFCRGGESFGEYMDLSPSIASDVETLTRILEVSLQAKKWFVEVDEFDRGERMLLNLGHTFGHALEAASGFRIAHGVAVGLGIVAAQALATRLGHIYAAGSSTEQLMRHIKGLLRGVPDLDAALAAITVTDLVDAFSSDKKHSREEFTLILINSNNHVERVMLRRDDSSLAIVRAAFSDAIRGYSKPIG